MLRPAGEERANFSHPESPEIKFSKGKDKDSQVENAQILSKWS